VGRLLKKTKIARLSSILRLKVERKAKSTSPIREPKKETGPGPFRSDQSLGGREMARSGFLTTVVPKGENIGFEKGNTGKGTEHKSCDQEMET